MMRRTLIIVCLLVVSTACSAPDPGVTVTVGPTPIPRGDARGANDVTVNNGLFAVSFAAETAPPWGVARGGMLDVGIVRDGEIDYDFVSLIDFMPNRWSAWPTTYQSVEVDAQDADRVVVRVERDWGAVQLESHYEIRANSALIHVTTTMTNAGDEALSDLYSGYIAWPDGGTLFGVPGFHGVNVSPEEGRFAEWSAAYAENWAIGVHAPFSTHVAYDGRDRYLHHDLAVGDSQTFEAWLQIEPRGSLETLIGAELDRLGSPAGRVEGVARNESGEVIETPAVVLEQDGRPYAFVAGSNGRYAAELPVGEYQAYATAQNHDRSDVLTIEVTANSDQSVDFEGIEGPATVSFEIREGESQAPDDARISILKGPQSLIGYFGRNTLFTELDDKGHVEQQLPPGDYVFTISRGGGFTSQVTEIAQTLPAGSSVELTAVSSDFVNPRLEGWYSADLHHHSDVLDGFTEPEYVLRSQLAADLDLIFLSDHDSVINNAELQALSEARGLPFIPAVELSPSWAHFNAFPIDDDMTVDIDTGQATAKEVFAEARRMGADLVGANHPNSDYGYFTADREQAIPGGFDWGFDLVEVVNGAPFANAATVKRVMEMWNEDRRVFLVGGSDAHDVWLEESGLTRTYAYVPGELTVDKFVEAVQAGRSYASQGPLLFPNIPFGSRLTLSRGETINLNVDVYSAHNVSHVVLIKDGEDIDEQAAERPTISESFAFTLAPEESGWYSLVALDDEVRYAYSNPIWVTIEDAP